MQAMCDVLVSCDAESCKEPVLHCVAFLLGQTPPLAAVFYKFEVMVNHLDTSHYFIAYYIRH